MLIAHENDLFFKNDLNIYLVDFGLAHQYLDRNGFHVRQPNKVSFKGTISYCSLNLLEKQCKYTDIILLIAESKRLISGSNLYTAKLTPIK